ncbi:MAG: hypothetical protein RIF41_22175 [Polyangiaceae bacterium]
MVIHPNGGGGLMDKAEQLTETFRYVSAIYRTCATMLESADVPLLDLGYSPYDKWHAIWPKRSTSPEDHAQWLPTFVLRQYHRAGRTDKEALTIGAALWGYGSRQRELKQALCIASYMELQTGGPDDLYRWGLVQRWTEPINADGIPRILSTEDIRFEGGEEQAFLDEVVNGQVLSAAVRLPTVTTTSELMALVKPVIAEIPRLGGEDDVPPSG